MQIQTRRLYRFSKARPLPKIFLKFWQCCIGSRDFERSKNHCERVCGVHRKL